MNYLTKDVPIQYCTNCQLEHAADKRVEDAYDGSYCPNCGVSGQDESTERVESYDYWSVALYEVGQSYGGPEEGGWYYSTGNRILPSKMRVFEDYNEAVKYRKKLQTEFDDLTARGFSGKLPDEGWPNVRPWYC